MGGRLKSLALLALLCCLGLPAWGSEHQECAADLFEQLSGQLPVEDDLDVLASACAPAPGMPGKMLVTLILGDAAREEMHRPDLLWFVLLVDSRQGRVLSRFQTSLQEDSSLRPVQGMRLDTAPYVLAPGVRAFGVRDSFEQMPSCAEGAWEDSLSLYVVRGKRIVRVMDRLPMHESSATPSFCAEDSVVSDTVLSIAVAKTRTHGFADLLVTGRNAVIKHGDDWQNAPRKSLHYLLRFDGKAYPVSGPFGMFGDVE